MLTPMAAAVVLALSAIWLILLLAVLVRSGRDAASLPNDERALLVVTALLGFLWTMLGPPFELGSPERIRAKMDEGSSCFRVRDGMTVANVREVLQETPREVPEDDTRGPGARALVFDDQRCIVHLLNDRVIAVEDESRH